MPMASTKKPLPQLASEVAAGLGAKIQGKSEAEVQDFITERGLGHLATPESARLMLEMAVNLPPIQTLNEDELSPEQERAIADLAGALPKTKLD